MAKEYSEDITRVLEIISDMINYPDTDDQFDTETLKYLTRVILEDN